MALSSVASLMALIPLAVAQPANELFDGLVEVPEVGSEDEVVPVEEVPALPSDEPVELEPEVPEGDFSDPPLPPNAPLALEAEAEAADDPAFDPATSEVVEELTSPTRQVFDNENGTQTVMVTAGPERFRDASGEWVDIDLEFAEQPDGDVVVDDSRVPVELPAEDPGAVEVRTATGEYQVSAPDIVGEAVAPVEVDGATAVVAGEGGIETHIAATASGFEHAVVVPDAASPSSYRVDLTLPEGLTARQGPQGVEMVNAEGRIVSTFGGGIAFDSADSGWNGEETSVTVTLVDAQSQAATVDIAVADAWFEDPDRVFPVTIDPTFVGYINANSGLDTWVISGQSSSNAGHHQLRVGTVNSGSTYARSLLRFNLPPGNDTTQVSDARLSLYAEESQSCTATPVVLAGLDGSFSDMTVWSNQPPVLPSFPTTTTNTNKGGGTGCGSGRFDLDATQLVERWLQDSGPNFGLRLRAGNESLNSNRKVFSSGDAEDTAHQPRLTITYNTPPPIPVQVLPEHDSTVMTTTPTLTVDPEPDEDGQDLQYWFSVWTDDSPQWGGQVLTSGWINEPEWTVPEGMLVDGGHYYRAVYANDGEETSASIRRSFRVNLRLGAGGPSAYETVGPVTVNLANGNANVSAAGPQFPSVGGPVGATFAYNSQTPPSAGLSAKFYNDENHNGVLDETDPVAERTDPAVSFSWGQHAPVGGLLADDFLVRWTGSITVPSAGNWTFGGIHDNGMRVRIDGDLVYETWTNATGITPAFGTNTTTLAAGERVSIQVDYRDISGESYVTLWARNGGNQYPVPGSWLRPGSSLEDALPAGWTMSTPLGGSGPVRAVVTSDMVSFRTADGGTCCGFLRSVNDGSWDPGPGQTGRLVEDNKGRLTLYAADGTTYTFGANGSLTAMHTPADSDNPAVWTPDYDLVDDLPRLMSITDPVGASRTISFTYKGSGTMCPARPDSTFDTVEQVETGRLCAIDYWDGQQTRIFYRNGYLARITNVGPEDDDELSVVTDFAYGASGMDSVRGSLAAEIVASGMLTSQQETQLDTEITYADGRVDRIVQPAPQPGALRGEVTFEYTEDYTDVAVTDGPLRSPGAFSRRVTHDAAGQNLTNVGVDGLIAQTMWDAKDRPFRVIDGTGLRTDTVFDDYGNVTGTWGPAPFDWFAGHGVPVAGHIGDLPHSTASFDQGLFGLAATWWTNVDLAGPPLINRHGVGNPDGYLNADWGTGPPAGLGQNDNFSGRFVGWIETPTEKDWDFRFLRDGKVRMFIDDNLVIDEWEASSDNAEGDEVHLTAGLHRISVEYADTTGTANIQLRWFRNAAWEVVPYSYLTPGYGNATTEHLSNGQTVTRGYESPHLGITTTITTGSNGDSLATSADYEGAATDTFRRLTSTVNPAGNATTTSYYGIGAPQMRDDPCTAANDPVHQGGQAYKVTGPAPGGGTAARVEEFFYDLAGRMQARRTDNDPWTCTTFDDRGRPTLVEVPAFGGEPARDITYEYAVGGNPLVTRLTDSSNGFPVTSMIDALGRTVSTTDEWDKTTTITYDRIGRQVSSTGAGGTLFYEYTEQHGLLGVVRLREPEETTGTGLVLADVDYDDLSRVDHVTYPAGTGNMGNGTSLHQVTYDELGRRTSAEWRTGNDLLTSSGREFDNNGRIVNDFIDGTDYFLSGPNYTYDGVGRLVDARVPGHHYTYGYESTGGCGLSADAGLNTNRTSMSDNGGTPTTYCYDHADRLTSTTATGLGTLAYDDHGNITTYGNATLTYDMANRHMTTTVDGQTLRYERGASGAIIERDAPGDGTGTEATLRYSSGPAGMGLVLNIGKTVIERTISLPGGASLTLGTGETWSYPNLAGSVAATADGDGVKIGDTHHYDPYGNPLNGLPDNRQGSADSGWLGAGTEHSDGFPPLIEMGARVYSPQLGRFLQVDPIRGGSANGYDYAAGDPINYHDGTGTFTDCNCNNPPPAASGLDVNPAAFQDHGQAQAQILGQGASDAEAARYANQSAARALLGIYAMIALTVAYLGRLGAQVQAITQKLSTPIASLTKSSSFDFDWGSALAAGFNVGYGSFKTVRGALIIAVSPGCLAAASICASYGAYQTGTGIARFGRGVGQTIHVGANQGSPGGMDSVGDNGARFLRGVLPAGEGGWLDFLGGLP